MPGKKVRFENDAGVELVGLLDLPPGPPRAWALFAHCFTCGKNLKAAGNIARSLTEAGIAVMRFDFTGLGESEGDFSDTTYSSNVADLVAAANWLAENHEAPSILVGHSLGGTAVLQAAFDIPSAAAVATIGSPSTPSHVAHLFEGARESIEADGEAMVDLGGRPFTIKRSFLEDLDKHPMPEAIGGLRKALLVMHAPLDATVEIDEASVLYQSAKHPKSFISLDRADHLLSQGEDSLYAGAVLTSWASRYLPTPEATNVEPAPGEVVARTRSGGFFTELNADGHEMVADEPTAYGGTNLGPTPYDLLSAALASCTSMTLRMYADRKGYDYDSFSVAVKHAKIHATDCIDCETTDGKIDEFTRTVSMNGEFTQEQRQRMLEIADRCPVHKTMHSEVKVRTKLG